jgi:hypothetical protein
VEINPGVLIDEQGAIASFKARSPHVLIAGFWLD